MGLLCKEEFSLDISRQQSPSLACATMQFGEGFLRYFVEALGIVKLSVHSKGHNVLCDNT